MGNETKAPKGVAIVNVRDYPRSQYAAYWIIDVRGNDAEGYRWSVNFHTYKPLGYDWQGKRHDKWPEGVERPVYPEAPPIKQDEYLQLPEVAEQGELSRSVVRSMQHEHRALCAAIYESHPKPVHHLAEVIGTADTRDEADLMAQQVVLDRMESYRFAPSSQSGHALVLGPLGMIGEFLRWLFGPLFALAFSSTLRDARAQAIIDTLDSGAAALFRIYDGSRPGTCGAATTLLAEITHADPSATKSSGVTTFSGTPLSDTAANATGTATWFRQTTSTGTCVIDGDVGTSGSDLNMNSTSISINQEVQLTSYTITEGNA